MYSLIFLNTYAMQAIKNKIQLKRFILPALILCSLFAEGKRGGDDDDKNVIIEYKKQSFLFKQDKGENPVLIKENYSTDLRSRRRSGNILYTEMYNDHETVDAVDVSVRNRPFRGVDIKYDYYSIKDIFYSDARVCYFKIPFDEVGVPAKVTISKTYKDPRYFTKVYFTEEYFVQNKVVEFIIPRWMKCELKEYNFGGNEIKKDTGYDAKLDADVYTYTMRNLPALLTIIRMCWFFAKKPIPIKANKHILKQLKTCTGGVTIL